MKGYGEGGLNVIVSPFGDGFGFSMKTSDDYDELMLHPEELGLLSAKAVPKRRIEFCIGRAAAHSALSKIDINNFPILKGVHNEPLWPQGVVGAISHSGRIALAAVANEEKAAGIGIDIEMLDETISRDIVQVVCTKREAIWVNRRKDRRHERLFMIFSAKESVFKAFSPRTNRFLNYFDAELIWHEDISRFRGNLLTRVGADYGGGYTFEVGCRKFDRYIFTFMSLPSLL
jgi:enterobactin synthetase component D